MASGFKFDPKGILEGLSKVEDKSDEAIHMYADQGALKLQNYAKENRRWTDRTGAARSRLKGDALPEPNGYKLRLAHGVNYGIWLELANEKRYAIIPETIETVGEGEIMPGFDNLMEKLR